MSFYGRFLRITEGNKRFARSIVAFLKSRDKLTAFEWRENLKPLLESLSAEINTAILSHDQSFWTLANLKQIRNQVNGIVAKYDAQFSSMMESAQNGVASVTIESMKKQFTEAGLSHSGTFFHIDQIIAGIHPLTANFISGYFGQMSKIINNEIAIGLSNGLSVSEVAQSIEDKFDSSQMSYARAEKIAMTELNRASSFAQHQAGIELKANNPTLKKIWINSHKPAARQTHIDVEEETTKNPIDIEEDFEVVDESTGETEYGQFPRDPSFSAGNSVNCGCTVIYVNGEDKEMIETIRQNQEEEA